jgi:hypothetical protein
MTKRDVLHGLLDELPGELLSIAEARLVDLRDDPFVRFLIAAPVDEEPLDDEDLDALAEADAELARGETISLAEFDRRHGTAE